MNQLTSKFPKFLNVALTFLIVVVGWVVFRTPTFNQALGIYAQMFDLSSFGRSLPNFFEAEVINCKGWFVFSLAAAICFAPLSEKLMSLISQIKSKNPFPVFSRAIWAVCLLILSVIAIAESGFSPFLYYQF